ncbi:hypothetical protein TH63_16185 [Rufibacter radiotolerans]|uniref:DUF4142 domain-containing protein n=1 Tax=Rufibacter radiotolerans TaxID=1379910 RepID=A0A0H4W8P9_9BACT|nr:DUF4142 domain-containing protein [Rufibacter radiotolerans]AKQ46816.1 hypothetical protein TH63_16185 [Rufibacter radiotolerans]
MKKLMPLFAVGALLTGAACNTYTATTDPADLATGYSMTPSAVPTTHTSSKAVAEANNNATFDNPATGATPDSAAAIQNQDQAFLMKAASGGMMEVEAGKLASTKAKDAAVKQFGQRMVTDHTKANTELKALAAKKGITLPAGLMAEHQSHLDMLSKATAGAEFDQVYMQHMVQAHDKDIMEFERQSASGQDAEVKAFAAKTLPVLRDHRKAAQPIFDKLKK